MKFKSMFVANATACFLLAGVPAAQAVERPSLLSGPASVTQQHRTVTGTVVDANGEPVVGASVVVKGTSRGTTTDAQGNFSISVSSNTPLEISYIGFKTQTVPTAGKSVVKVTLSDDTGQIDEVVVVGYGTVKKADLAGSVGVMDNKSFRDQPVTQITDALQGRVSGVQVTTSGGPGGDVRIRVRGAGSINRSNDPLYVVDGMVRESGLEGMDPEDIQSIQVLKDASSTAIYGSRGSNGVVLVTTKTGRAGDDKIIFDAAVGFGNVAKRMDLMSPYEFATAWNEAHPGTFNESQMKDFQSGKAGTDWQDMMYQTAVTQNYKLVVTGGTAKNQYYVSGNYMDNRGDIINTSFKRYQFKANISSKVKKWLELTADIDGSYNKGRSRDFSAVKGNTMWTILNFAPAVSCYDANGNFNLSDPYSALLQVNPVAVAKESSGEFHRANFQGHVDLKFNILKGLTFTTSNGFTYRDSKSYGFSPRSISRANSNSMSNSDWQETVFQSTNNLTYLGNWGKHHLTATAVWEATKEESKSMGINGSNILVESVGWWNVKMAASRNESNAYSSWALLSGVGRLMYNYDDRYILTGTFREDGSSKFTNNKWGFFPSAAVAWNLGNESFMKSQNIIQNAKIRMSYGTVGSQAISPYGTLGMLSSTSGSFGTGTLYTGYWLGTNVATPDLTWEKTNQFDLGVEFSILGGKLNFTFDYFNKLTKDGLIQKTMPKYDGGGSYWVNAAKVKNTGFDFGVEARLNITKDLFWSSNLTGSYLKNKVKDLAGVPFVSGISPASGMIPTDGVTRIQEGYPIGTFYVYEWTGLDKDGKDTYKDNDGDGKVSGGDRVMKGQAAPKFTMGWNNSFSYKNWSLNMFFNAAFGGYRLNLMRFTGCSINGDSNFITLREAYNRSVGHSDNPRYPSTSVVGNDYEAASTKWLEKNDYLRLENITLSYDLGRSITKFADIRLSFSAQNLFTITGYKGQDPAGISRMGSGSVDANDGIDIGAYPRPRIFTFGARLTF